MRLAVVASTLILVTTSAWSCALAQGTPSREAPVGHRQPKATEVPPDQETAFEKKQKELGSRGKMSLVFTQMALMVGLWLGLALIILFAEVILLDIFDHRAGNGQRR